jgi:hypothetical protein
MADRTTWENRRQYLVGTPVTVPWDWCRWALRHRKAPPCRDPLQRSRCWRGSVGRPHIEQDIRQCGRGIEFLELKGVVRWCADREQVRPAQRSDLRVCPPQQQTAASRRVESKCPAIETHIQQSNSDHRSTPVHIRRKRLWRMKLGQSGQCTHRAASRVASG